MTDQDYMRQALLLAGKAKGVTSPNPCVGAVVVKDQRIVGKGFHRAPGHAHAEVEALDDAGSNARGATIYVTLEPCNHFGKTPPCTHEIINSGIKKVVVGCKDPNPNVCGGGIAFLEEKGIPVVSGILEKEAVELIEEFIWYTQNDKKPFVTLKCASTLDGRIATSTGDSKWISNEKSRAFVHKIRHETDAILIGTGTLKADDPSLTSRIPGVRTKDPTRIVLDTHLKIDPDAKILTQTSDADTILITGPGVCEKKKTHLEKNGVQIIEIPLKEQKLDLGELMIILGQMSIMSLLIEGGGILSGSALKAGIVNKVLFFLAPKILGGSDGVPVFSGGGAERISDAFKLGQVNVSRFDDDILVKGYLK